MEGQLAVDEWSMEGNGWVTQWVLGEWMTSWIVDEWLMECVMAGWLTDWMVDEQKTVKY